MEKLSAIWNYLSGKKTSIGAIILTLAFIITQVQAQVFVSIWNIEVPSWVDKSVLTLEWIGSVFSGVGVLHKSLKTKVAKV